MQHFRTLARSFPKSCMQLVSRLLHSLCAAGTSFAAPSHCLCIFFPKCRLQGVSANFNAAGYRYLLGCRELVSLYPAANWHADCRRLAACHQHWGTAGSRRFAESSAYILACMVLHFDCRLLAAGGQRRCCRPGGCSSRATSAHLLQASLAAGALRPGHATATGCRGTCTSLRTSSAPGLTRNCRRAAVQSPSHTTPTGPSDCCSFSPLSVQSQALKFRMSKSSCAAWITWITCHKAVTMTCMNAAHAELIVCRTGSHARRWGMAEPWAATPSRRS